MPNRPSSSEQAVGHRLDGLVASLLNASAPEDLFQITCGLCREICGAVGVAVLAKDAAGSVRAAAASPMPPEGAEKTPPWLAALAHAYGQLLAGNSQIIALSGESNAHAVFVPLVEHEHGSLALAAYITGGRKTRLQSVLDIMLLLRGVLLLAERQTRTPQPELPGGDPARLLDILDILSEVQSSDRFYKAAASFCSEIAGKTGCRRVALGEVGASNVRAVAVSQMESFARGTRMVRLMEESMQECLDQDRIVFYSSVPGEEVGDGVITRAAREFSTLSGVPRVLCLPLRDRAGIRYVALFLLDQEELPPDIVDRLSLICRLLTPRLIDLRLAEEPFLRKAWRHFLFLSADIFGPRRTALKIAGALLGIFLFLTLVIRGDLVVSAPLIVEGVHSYTHTAPMDSYLLEVLVRPGDEIKKGQLMGRLDATEIRLEIAALEAQLNIHRNQNFQLMQEGKAAEAAIAALEAEKDEANLAWANTRLMMTELRASVDGFLVSEDMYPRLGQPVRRGQELFEVTDTSSQRVVVHVAEEDVSDIILQMERGPVRGKFTLTAYPDLPVEFTVERVHPFATVQNDSNGFEVRGVMGAMNGGPILRPGMEGYAHITAGREPMLFLWTKKLVNRMRMLWWKWM